MNDQISEKFSDICHRKDTTALGEFMKNDWLDELSFAALNTAIRSEWEEGIKILIKAGVNVDTTDKDTVRQLTCT